MCIYLVLEIWGKGWLIFTGQLLTMKSYGAPKENASEISSL